VKRDKLFFNVPSKYVYEDFIEGIKPQIEEDSDGNKTVIYEVKNGLFKLISEKAQQKRLKQETINYQFDFDDAWDSIINDANVGLENNTPLNYQSKLQTWTKNSRRYRKRKLEIKTNLF
jgi:hypothetical protein